MHQIYLKYNLHLFGEICRLIVHVRLRGKNIFLVNKHEHFI